MFGISHLKKSYVRTPTDKTVNNISDCRSECSKASDSTNPSGDMVTSQRATQDVDSTKFQISLHFKSCFSFILVVCSQRELYPRVH